MANTPKSPRPAVFLDRDGALIEEAHYLSKVEQVRLLPGVVDGLRLLERAGFLVQQTKILETLFCWSGSSIQGVSSMMI